MTNIYQKISKLIKYFALFSVVLPMMTWANVTFQMSNPNDIKVNVRLAITRLEHTRGLSGIKSSDFPLDQSMLFVNDGMGMRRFWMPDTHFNLDIIFLDSDLKIVGIEKNVPMHPGIKEPPVIYKTKDYRAQFILETKANAPFSKKIKMGDKLKWISNTPISEIVLKSRLQQ